MYLEQFETKEEAMRREYAIKHMKRKEKLQLIENTEAFLNLHIFLDLEFTPDAIVCHVEGRCFVYDY